MKHRLPLFVLLAALGGAALAEEYRLGDLVVEDPWARELPPVSETGAAWFRVVNHGGADRIVSVQSPVAERAELHTHEVEDGMSRKCAICRPSKCPRKATSRSSRGPVTSC